MKDIVAKPILVDGKYRIEVTIEGEKICLGKSLDEVNILFKFTEYDTEAEAIKHIKDSERLLYTP